MGPWGGIEAEAGMLGQPVYFLTPEVVGVELTGSLKEGITATDLTLTITEKLRALGVVGKFVEYYGEGARKLSLADRATIANMAPEYGATMGFFLSLGSGESLCTRPGTAIRRPAFYTLCVVVSVIMAASGVTASRSDVIIFLPSCLEGVSTARQPLGRRYGRNRT